MKLDLVGYVLGLLDADECCQIQDLIRDDPAVRKQISRIQSFIAPLESLRHEDVLPRGLAERTVAYVLAKTAPAPADQRLTPAQRVSWSSDRPLFQPSRWRWADALVAACILVVLGGLGISGVGRMQQRREIATCQNNMRQVHFALADYSGRHRGNFPQVQEEPPYNVAGAYAPILQEAGTLPSTGVPECPSVNVVRFGNEPPLGYAYTLGFRDQQGRLHGLRNDLLPGGADLLPILADRVTPIGHRTGYNVLFIGGHVRFCTSTNVGVDADDIFTNQASEIRAGLHGLDTVLATRDIMP